MVSQGSRRFSWVLLAMVGALGIVASLGTGAEAQGIEWLERQLDIRPHQDRQGLSRDVADQLLRLGSQERQAGNYDQAIAAWYQAIDIYNALGDLATAGVAYDYIGLTHAQRGQYNQAEVALRWRLAVAQDNQDFWGQVRGWNNLGSVFVQRGRLTTAAEAFETALNIAMDVNDYGGVGLSLSNLGLVAQIQGNLDDALKYYERATVFRGQARDLAGVANSSNNLAALYARTGDNQAALGTYLVARDTAQRSGDVLNHLRALDGLIALYLDRNELLQVEAFLGERLALTATEAATPYQQMLSWIRTGEYHQQRQDAVAAIAAYGAALALARDLGDKPQEAALMNLIRSLQRPGESP